MLSVRYGELLWQRSGQHDLGDDSDPESRAGRQRRHWMNVLDHLPEEIELPLDHPRAARVAGSGTGLVFGIGPATHRGLDRLARECSATTAMVLHAAVAALLYELGAGSDIPLGITFHGRDDERLRGLVGCLVNIVPLRVDLSGCPTYRELLGRVRHGMLAAQENQDFPLDRMVELVNPARSRTRHPLFQVAVTYNDTDPAAAVADWPAPPEVRTYPIRVRYVDPDLSLEFHRVAAEGGEPAGIGAVLVYADELFEASTVEWLVDRLRNVLELFGTNPDQSVRRPSRGGRTFS